MKKHKFLETSKLLKLSQKETYSLNSIIVKEIEFVVIYLPTKKTTGSGNLTIKFYQTFKKLIMPVLYIPLQKIGEQDILSNSFCKDGIAMLLKAKTLQENKTIDQYSL